MFLSRFIAIVAVLSQAEAVRVTARFPIKFNFFGNKEQAKTDNKEVSLMGADGLLPAKDAEGIFAETEKKPTVDWRIPSASRGSCCSTDTRSDTSSDDGNANGVPTVPTAQLLDFNFD